MTKDQRRLLVFQVAIDGRHEPYVPVAKFLSSGENYVDLKAGENVKVTGTLRHHPRRGLFVSAVEITILEAEK